MGQYQTLDGVFQALADPTRRAVIARLGRSDASISTLAEPFEMALPSFLKHIRALEAIGLVRTEKHGRVRNCSLDREQLQLVSGWLEEQRAIWEQRTDRLENFVIEQTRRKDDK